MAELTQMMQQYMETKRICPLRKCRSSRPSRRFPSDKYFLPHPWTECPHWCRLGDFYEMFFDDALTASRELEITLTGKSYNLGGRKLVNFIHNSPCGINLCHIVIAGGYVRCGNAVAAVRPDDGYLD